jgi:hypothetical protein
MQLQEEGTIVREDLIREILISSNNRLSLKMWFLLKQYGDEPFQGHSEKDENQHIQQLLTAIIEGKIEQAIDSYTGWITWLSQGRELT